MIGHRIIKLESVDSTNSYVTKKLEKNAQLSHGEVFIANEQKNGKGHGSNSWESEPGKNLSLSIFLEPSFLQAEEQFLLNMAISLGVYDFVLAVVKNKNVKLKWPNDIYIGKKKVGGILISHSVSGMDIMYTIAGIGLNINQVEFKSDAPNPASLIHFFGENLDLNVCLKKLLSCIDLRYLQLENGGDITIANDYLNVMLGYDQWRNYIYKTNNLKAKITGISKFGMLQLIDEYQKELECDFKEIEFIF